jgi:predicted small integral membrane protein
MMDPEYPMRRMELKKTSRFVMLIPKKVGNRAFVALLGSALLSWNWHGKMDACSQGRELWSQDAGFVALAMIWVTR